MAEGVPRALIDWHTHVWLPEHLGSEHEAEMAARTGRNTTATPERHRAAVEAADRFVVVGIKWGRLGANVPNDFTAKYVAQYPGRAVGFASVDPNDPAAPAELERSVTALGLKGLKLSPVYQGFDPWSPPAWRLYEVADGLGIPIMFHQAAAFAAQSTLEYGNPVLLDKVARSFPRLRIIVAHLGQPWVEETVQLLRKHKTMFADLSARYYRRWQFYNAMQHALDYQVTGQLLFGSDFPMQTTREAADAFRAMNDFGPGVSLPRVPEAVIESILYERPFSLLGLGP
jgi:predicted TIM-barrel fold metal-dependent hydrolase